jgi:peptidoglycan/LPS O-acetylase OafA/YrhL
MNAPAAIERELVSNKTGVAARLLRHLLSPFTDTDRKHSSSGDSIFALDGVRALAAAIVIASHTYAFGLQSQGGLGVFLFFILSGFVLTIPFADRPQRIADRTAVLAFFTNRVLRIVPAMTVAVLWIAYQRGEGWTWMLANLSLYAGWEHLWSVAEEARFYLLFPLIVTLAALLPTRSTRIVALCGMIVLAWQFRQSHQISEMDGRSVQFYLWLFITGIMLCFLYATLATTGMAKNGIARHMGGIAPLLIVLLIFAGSDAMVEGFWRRLFPGLPDFSLNGWQCPELWCALLALFLLEITLFRDSLVSRCLQSWFMRHLGLLSYGFYLFHIPVITWLGAYKLERSFFVVMASTYVAAIVSYVAVEKPFLMLKLSAKRGRKELGREA